MSHLSNFFVAVTGAQGVGKSTFCRALRKQLEANGRCTVALLDGLGAQINALGIPYGSASTPATIAAVFAAHLEREASAPAGIVVLDRCVVDALAYTRTLGVSSDVERRLYERVAALAADRLGLVVHLSLSPSFAGITGSHETVALRAQVAETIPVILAELGLPNISLDAASGNAVDRAAVVVLEGLA